MIPELKPISFDTFTKKISTLRNEFDSFVVLASTPIQEHLSKIEMLRPSIELALSVDASLNKPSQNLSVIPAREVPGGRLILVSLGSLDEDTDDVRVLREACIRGVSRAVDAGSTKPLVLVFAPTTPKFAHACEIVALAALASQWVPLEAREAGRAPTTATTIGIVGLTEVQANTLSNIERGRVLCRDITGTEPERTTPRRVAEMCKETFANTSVQIHIEHDVSSFPLLAAVARASTQVERHKPCVVKLEYIPQEPVHSTVFLIGKGVTYDTGGADLKTDGHMAGMSRDKGGAGAVAGLVYALAQLKIAGVRVVGLLGLVRNSIGEESFVSDEIIRARSGVRVRIGNTDAEGRLVLADLLAYAKELASSAQGQVSFFSIATLTGHVYRAFGPYIGMLANAAAREKNFHSQLDQMGELWGEPLEQSRPRREDYAFITGRSLAEDVLSCNRLASVNTPRGHQYPFAFLDVVSGLKGSPYPYVHLDIGGAAVDPPDWQLGKPTASPLTMLAAWVQHRTRSQ